MTSLSTVPSQNIVVVYQTVDQVQHERPQVDVDEILPAVPSCYIQLVESDVDTNHGGTHQQEPNDSCIPIISIKTTIGRYLITTTSSLNRTTEHQVLAILTHLCNVGDICTQESIDYTALSLVAPFKPTLPISLSSSSPAYSLSSKHSNDRSKKAGCRPVSQGLYIPILDGHYYYKNVEVLKVVNENMTPNTTHA